MRTKNLEYNLLLLEVLLTEYENFGILEIRRGRLLSLCQKSYDKKYGGYCELGTSTFQRCLADIEDEMAIVIVKSKNPRSTKIKLEIQRIKKLVNDIKSQQGLYRLDEKIQSQEIASQEIEPKAWEQYLQQVANASINNFNSPWINDTNEHSKYAHKVAQQCASILTAKLVSSRFGFTLTRQGNSELIDEYDLCQLAIVTSKIASKDLKQPFKLLIDFSGAPQSGQDWGLMWNKELRLEILAHFKIFAEHLFKFRFTKDDLYNLQEGYIDNLSMSARYCFDIFYKNYLLPTLKTIGWEYK